MLRKFGWALAAAASIAAFGPATAADLPVKARPVVVPIYNWTGCYIGLSAGGKGIATSETVYTAAAGPFAGAALDLGRRDAEGHVARGRSGRLQLSDAATGCSASKSMDTPSAGATTDILAGVMPCAVRQRQQLRAAQRLAGLGPRPYRLRLEPHPVLRNGRRCVYRGPVPQVNWLPLFWARRDRDARHGRWSASPSAQVSNMLSPTTLRSGWKAATAGTSASGSTSATCPSVRRRQPAGARVREPAWRDVKLETGEILVKANWKFGPTAVVARY